MQEIIGARYIVFLLMQATDSSAGDHRYSNVCLILDDVEKESSLDLTLIPKTDPRTIIKWPKIHFELQFLLKIFAPQDSTIALLNVVDWRTINGWNWNDLARSNCGCEKNRVDVQGLLLRWLQSCSNFWFENSLFDCVKTYI